MNNDLISRQAAIDALEELKELDYELYIRTSYCHLMEEQWDFVIKRYKEAIKETPCAQPKTGRWEKTLKSYEDEEQAFDYYEITCSECGEEPENEYHLTRFCPHCGARMEGGEEHG